MNLIFHVIFNYHFKRINIIESKSRAIMTIYMMKDEFHSIRNKLNFLNHMTTRRE